MPVSARVLLLSGMLAALGCGIAAYKSVVLGYDFIPRTSENSWVVQLETRLQGSGQRARVRIYLPKEDQPGQRIYDERVLSEGMRFFIRPMGGNRVGHLSGQLDGRTNVSYRFSVDLTKVVRPLPTGTEIAAAGPHAVHARYSGSSESVQSDDPEMLDRLREITDGGAKPLTQVRSIFDYTTDEILAVVSETRDDALTVLQKERGDPVGIARLFVALCRAAGIPARVVGGLQLEEGQNDIRYWAEVHLAGRWFPMDPVAGHYGTIPKNRFLFFEGDRSVVWTKDLDTVSTTVTAVREQASQRLLFQRRVRRSDHVLDRVSLLILPARTQMTLRLLLLLPFGALMVAVWRNLIGIPTFGTFMPVLLALAFLETTLLWGIALLLTIIFVGWSFRAVLDRLQLLMVPRLAILLTIVIGIVVVISLISEAVGTTAGLSVSLFPIVILTATIERFSIISIEEGTRNALKVTGGTIIVAIACYAIIGVDTLQRTVLAFPEMLLLVLASLLLIGRYTGYRLSEWFRFSPFRSPKAG